MWTMRIGLLVVLLVGPGWAATGLGIVGSCSTTGCAGDMIVCTARLQNKDTEGNRWAALDMRTVIHHADGSVTDSGNVLPAPVPLTTFKMAFTAPIPTQTDVGDANSTLRVDVLGRGAALDVAGAFWNGRATVLVTLEDCGP